MVTQAWTDLLIHDVGKNPIVIIPIGTAKISRSYLRIGHHINVTSLEATIDSLDTITESKIIDHKIMSPIIKTKLTKLHSIFDRLKPPRQKRWESLGRAWKYVSGSPDADDLRIINSTMNSLIDQNDKQIRINSVLEIRLRNITKAINSFINFHDETIESFESINLIFNLDELIHQLEMIEEAITLARHNIPSSRIISSGEIALAQDFLRSSGLGTSLLDDILDISSAYVLFGKDEIIYTLKVPRIKDIQYQLNFIEPVISNNHQIHLTAKYYLNGPNSFLTNTQCTKHRNQYICNYSQLEPLGECIQQLIDGKSTQCPMEKVYGQNFIKKINEANILVNAENITLTSNCSAQSRELQGSYLIQFSRCTIKLNNEEYTNINADIPLKLYIPTTGLTVTPTKIMDKMPLQYLQDFNLEHRNHIEYLNMTTDNLHWKLHLFSWFSFGTLSTLALVYIVVLTVRTALSLSNRATRISISGEMNKESTSTSKPTITTKTRQDENKDHRIKMPNFIVQQPSVVKAEDDFQAEGESLGHR